MRDAGSTRSLFAALIHFDVLAVGFRDREWSTRRATSMAEVAA
jgi:hypothetical protein